MSTVIPLRENHNTEASTKKRRERKRKGKLENKERKQRDPQLNGRRAPIG